MQKSHQELANPRDIAGNAEEAERFCSALTLWPPGKLKVNEKG